MIAALAGACAGEVTGVDEGAGGSRDGFMEDDHRDVAAAVQALSPPVSTLPLAVVRLDEMSRATTDTPMGLSWSDLFFRTTGTRSLHMYFWTMSNGRFALRNAGIFRATITPTFDSRAGVNADDGWELKKAKRTIRAMLDAGFNFATWDTNGNGRIEPRELVMFTVEPGHAGGSMRGTFNLPAGNRNIATWIPSAGDQSQFANYAHELAHSWGMLDLYGNAADVNGNTTNCLGEQLTLASCTVGLNNQTRRYYLDPIHRRDFGWYLSGEILDRDVAATPSGSALIAPASATLSRPSGSVRVLDLRRGSDHYLFEFRKRDGQWDNEVASEGVIAWFTRRDSANQPIGSKYAYGGVHTDAIFPVAAEICHIDEVSGRGPEEAIAAGTYWLRSSKTAWNVRLTVSAPNASGAVPISWQTVANADDNRCQFHKSQSASQVVARTPEAMDAPRSRFNSNQSRAGAYTTTTNWHAETLPTASFNLGNVVTVSDGPNLVRAFASDHMGRLVMATRSGSTWSSWAAITGVEMPPLAPVTAVSRRPGQLDVFWIGNDGSMRTTASAGGTFPAPWRVQDPANIFYNNSQFFPGSRITSISRGPFNIHVYAVGTWFGNPVLFDAEWRDYGWWRFNAVMSGDVRPANNIAAVARTRERIDLVTSNNNGNIRYSALTFSADDYESAVYSDTLGPFAGLAAQTPYAIVSRIPNQIDIFALDTQGRIVTAYVKDWWPGSSAFPISGANSARAQSANTQLGAVARSSDHLDVFVNGPDGNIASTWWHEGLGWSEFALPF